MYTCSTVAWYLSVIIIVIILCTETTVANRGRITTYERKKSYTFNNTYNLLLRVRCMYRYSAKTACRKIKIKTNIDSV